MKLAGKVAIVTGAGRGIGRGIAAALGAEGATVVLADLDIESGEDTAARLTREGQMATFVRTDVADAETIDELVTTTLGRLGRIDVLVNNASVSLGQSFLDTTSKVWSRTLAVNQTGTFLCAQRVARSMVERSIQGRIINMASINSLAAERGAASYVTTKGAILALTRAMAVDLAPHGILVNAIAPGPIRTEITRRTFDEPRYSASIAEAIPLARAGTVKEVGGVAVFLASDDSTFVNGTVIVVDGGYSAYIRLG